MFNLVIATSQALYLELGLSKLFDRLCTKLDGKVIEIATCEKLLVRC